MLLFWHSILTLCTRTKDWWWWWWWSHRGEKSERWWERERGKVMTCSSGHLIYSGSFILWFLGHLSICILFFYVMIYRFWLCLCFLLSTLHTELELLVLQCKTPTQSILNHTVSEKLKGELYTSDSTHYWRNQWNQVFPQVFPNIWVVWNVVVLCGCGVSVNLFAITHRKILSQ